MVYCDTVSFLLEPPPNISQFLRWMHLLTGSLLPYSYFHSLDVVVVVVVVIIHQ